MQDVQSVPLHEATRERYLSYALSVITARALPDVRDGLKPVQRRILYTMFKELSLHPDGRYRKSAAVVGEVMGKYHPHGDQAIYDAMVRMAQDFSLRYPLVDPQGNFGSIDGDPPAAMRYTECKLQAIAEELLQEIKKKTVDFRSTYDGQRSEPIVLPAQFPQLLVNGVEGIAVGLATRIPPHNLGEVLDACVAMIGIAAEHNHSFLPVQLDDVLKHVKGPDLPTAGTLVGTPTDIRKMYETGRGSLKVRAEYRMEKDGRRHQIVVHSIPYGQNKAKIIEKIGEYVQQKKLPQVVDVRDESTDIIRVVLDLRQGASPETVMAFLYKRTNLESSISMNMNVLVPTDNPDVAIPARLDLVQVLRHWLTFRFETVRRRFQYDLDRLLERIHILEGLEILFDDLDRAIQIIRASDGKRDAAKKLMAEFPLSEAQTEAILELKLYRLAKLEILAIREELAEKRAMAEEIRQLLASKPRMWARVRSELEEIRRLYGDKRRTSIGGEIEAVQFDESAFVVDEPTFVVVTRNGWLKRQSSFSSLDKIRVRDHDSVGWIMKTSTRKTVTFFTSTGAAYTTRAADIIATTGYGAPLSSMFNLDDGASIVSVVCHDPKLLPEPADPEASPPPPHIVALTIGGRVVRGPLALHTDVSTKNGRRYARLNTGDRILAAYPAGGSENICVATLGARALVFPVSQVPPIKASGKGTLAIKLRDGDQVMAFELAKSSIQGPMVVTNGGREFRVSERKFGVGTRAGKGAVVLRRGSIQEWQQVPQLQLGGDA